MFPCEEKVIITYVGIKYKYGYTKIVNDHPEYEWNINDVKKPLKKTEKTGDVAQKEGSGRPKGLCTQKTTFN